MADQNKVSTVIRRRTPRFKKNDPTNFRTAQLAHMEITGQLKKMCTQCHHSFPLHRNNRPKDGVLGCGGRGCKCSGWKDPDPSLPDYGDQE